MRLAVLFLAFIAMAYCEPVVKEPQDLSVEDQGEHEMEKRHSYYCSARRCYYHRQCPGGYCYYSRCCYSRKCTHQSHCSSAQCCARHYSHWYGSCLNLKQPGHWCPWKKPDGYHCGCVRGYYCKRYGYHHYWGTCVKTPTGCSSDSSCKKTECCSGRRCKPRKAAGGFCPLKGADIYHCGCIEGFECQKAGVGNYWGRCRVKVVPPTEEPGSGLGA